ncbi:hypothetical protein BJ912DRAFT_1121174 [Pholiota molesta]|nr:hypothetical protein BJ912DRAFT_1121174 [Pholiota molesta]
MTQQNPLAEELAGILIAARNVVNGNYSSCITFTLLFYDTLLMFPKELEYIWSNASIRSKWSTPKVIYILVRYYALIHLGILLSIVRQTSYVLMFRDLTNVLGVIVDANSTAGWYLCPVVFQTGIFFVITMRLHALYNRSTKVLGLLVVLILGDFAVALQGSIITGIKISGGLIPVPLGLPMSGCLTEGSPSKGTLLRIWITSWSVSAIHFGMTMNKFLEGRRYRTVIKRERQIPPLLTAFFRDGIVFYLVITVMILVSAIIEQLVLPEFGSICLPWFIGIYSFAGSHLIISLREAAARGLSRSRGGSTWKDAISVLYFVPETRSGNLG